MTESLNRIYEGMFLVDSAVAASNWDEVIETVNTVFRRAQAEVVSLRKWDERRLCHVVKGRQRGTYLLSYFKADPGKIGQIERDVQISEIILRVLILKADHMKQEEMDAPTPAERMEQAAPEDEDGTESKDSTETTVSKASSESAASVTVDTTPAPESAPEPVKTPEGEATSD